MSIQGQPSNIQSHQASDDELAAIYLRDRDVPCPSCDYNRRGGQTSTCPECGSALTLIGINAAQVSNFTKLARSVLFYLWVYALLAMAYKLYGTIQMVITFYNVPRPRMYYSWIVTATITTVFWLTIFIVSIRRWRRLRNHELTTTKAVISPIVAILIFTLLRFMYDVAGFFV